VYNGRLITYSRYKVNNDLNFSQGPIDYASFKPASVKFQLVLNQALLRAMQVADTFSDGDNGQDYNQGEKMIITNHSFAISNCMNIQLRRILTHQHTCSEYFVIVIYSVASSC